ncbi:MAG TPA: cell division protein ZapA [Rhodanobacteraceae bacterium]
MSEPVSIKLIDREFLVACEPEERDGLLEAAAFLDARMRKLRQAAKTPGFDRLAVLAAVDIAHELLDLRTHQLTQVNQLAGSLTRLRHKLDAVLERVPTPL